MEMLRNLSHQLSTGELTTVQLLERCLAVIAGRDRGEDGLHAILKLNPDAEQLAASLDDDRARGQVSGALHGIPVVIKGNIDTADRMETTAGSLALKGHIARRDAAVVAKLRAAGALLLAKANLSEWANFRGARSVSGWSSLGGQTRNPYDSRRSPCGSSSGSAAAVAAGYCPVSVGTETDGSIVCPAQTCGIVAVKPTVGLISRVGIVPIAHSQDTAGAMARSVEDAALLLSALAGADPDDPATRAIPPGYDADFAAHLQPDHLRGVRLGVLRDCFGRHPRVDALIENRLQILRDLGAQVIDPVRLDTAGQWHDAEMNVLLHEFKHDLNAYLSSVGSQLGLASLSDVIEFNRRHADEVMPHFGQELMEQAQATAGLDDPAYVEALSTCRRLTRTEGIDAALQEHHLDALVAPTGTPAWLIDHVLGDFVLGSCSSAAAVAGYPHVTVPAAFLSGLPVGLSFIASAWQEASLLRYAFAFEGAVKDELASDLARGSR